MFGIAKTAIGGLGTLSVAIFAIVLPARDSVGIALLTLIIADVVAVRVYRRNADWSQLLRLFPWAVLGIVIGTMMLTRIDDVAARRLIGAIVVLLVLIRVVRSWLGRNDDLDERPHPWFAMVMGTIAGFTTMVANAAGPVMVLYLLAMRLPKLTFVGTTAWFFLAINLFKIPFSYYVGMLSLQSVTTSVRLWPFAIGGAFLGRWMLGHIDQQRFENLSLALALVAGLRLLL